jgi:ankyrin repeat protein
MSLTKASYSMITGAPANVLDFAADPTGVSDSSPAIQAALNSGAAHIHIPKGYYRIDTTLTAPTTVSIISGDGVNGTRLWSNTANGQYVLAENIAQNNSEIFIKDPNGQTIRTILGAQFAQWIF